MHAEFPEEKIPVGALTHTFHIPVMGTGYTADTPLKVGRYGINSTISLVDDVLLEQLRKYHCERVGEPFLAIGKDAEDPRASRITAYLDLLDRLVDRDIRALRTTPFETGSEITRYFEMLPDSKARDLYVEMLGTPDVHRREQMQDRLRGLVRRGRVDANIMTKIDRVNFLNGVERPGEFSDALAALRGFANSTLRSGLVLSAGLSPRLYGYLSNFEDFYADSAGTVKKEIILKVSDFRSALVQSKFIARSGLWVSELRIEASLNCGGHAFATEGHLLGPILEEFKNGREGIISAVRPIYEKALRARGRADGEIVLPPQRITVQGGIGTSAEDRFLREFYGVDGTGWATPFMLVPEVTNVDEEHLEKLKSATNADVYLSNSSPLGVPFWMLRNSQSEQLRMSRIAHGHPGCDCRKGYLAADTEFTHRPICVASHAYQEKKIKQLESASLTEAQLSAARKQVLDKACICHDLGGGVTKKLDIDPGATPTLCCGPNIINFSKTTTLEEMIGHIYGRRDLARSTDRPHMFMTELSLYFDELKNQMTSATDGLSKCITGYFEKFKKNIDLGMEYYRGLADKLPAEERFAFLDKLDELKKSFDQLVFQPSTAAIKP